RSGRDRCRGHGLPHRRRARAARRESALAGMNALIALGRLAVYRVLASPGIAAVRFVGVLVAVTLVAGVSLYSTALGDAMLQGSLSTDQGSLNLAVSDTSRALSPTTYQALDRYVRNREQADLGLPLDSLHVHHNTSTVPLYRLADLARPGKH